MKKIIALMLVVVFVFTLCACNSKNTVSETDTSTPISSETFVKPENYTSVLLISINPQFKLYLDENNMVLEVEPVNDDAKSFCESIDFKNQTVETVVGNIVEKANEKGFIKANVTVDFEITEQKDGFNNSDILTKVVAAANQKASELNIEIKTETKEKSESEIIENSEATTSSQPEETTKKEESTSKPTTTTKPTESKPTHTHEFSAATCAAPQKCSCGETKGSALGHKWQDATCQAPKTCSVCKLTEGVVQNHNYNGGFCITCRKQDPDATNPIKSLKFKTSYTAISEISETEIETVTFYFENTNTCDINFNSYSSEEGVPNLYIDYNGKRYFYLGGGGPTLVCELHEDKIIIKDINMLNETQYMTIKLNPNGSLVIIQDDILDMQNQVLKP